MDFQYPQITVDDAESELERYNHQHYELIDQLAESVYLRTIKPILDEHKWRLISDWGTWSVVSTPSGVNVVHSSHPDSERLFSYLDLDVPGRDVTLGDYILEIVEREKKP
jgi:hypothetical protein